MPGARGTRRVTPKAVAVLCLLAEVPGRVVSRTDLLAQAWPNTLPSDDVLTQAVTQLRKAFGAGAIGTAEGWAYIETIAKTGYRLTVPVRVMDAPALPIPDAGVAPNADADSMSLAESPAVPSTPEAALVSAPLRPARRVRERIMLATTSLLLVAVVLLGLMLVNMQAPSRAPGAWEAGAGLEKPYRLITNAAGFELSPTLSPDASMVAYAATGSSNDARSGDGASAILLQTTSSAPPRALTFPGPGVSDDLPVWSPDGRDIAFARWSPDGSCHIMLVAAVGGGDEREIARCDGSELMSFDWTPRGDALIVGSMTGDAEGGGIRLLDPGTGRWAALAYEVFPRRRMDRVHPESATGRSVANACRRRYSRAIDARGSRNSRMELDGKWGSARIRNARREPVPPLRSRHCIGRHGGHRDRGCTGTDGVTAWRDDGLRSSESPVRHLPLRRRCLRYHTAVVRVVRARWATDGVP